MTSTPWAPPFAEPPRDAIRTCAQALAQTAGVQIEHIAEAHTRTDEVLAADLTE